MRTSRIRATVLATATAALALSLTACGGADNGAKDDNAAGQNRSASGADAKGEAKSASATGGADATGKGATTSNTRQCVGDETHVTVEHRFAGQQGDHLLITMVNKSDKPCWVTSYPSVKLNGEGAALPLSKKSDGGDQHLTLQPNGTVYSAANLFDYGKDNHRASSISLALRDNDGRLQPEYSVDVTGAHNEFAWNEADVLNWNTEKPYDF
ncbi:DUF4232 domain-containing protein [Streptomyces catenulae]|uniref:DUF4232 domain-containing protein n=1 Tax=Streptomyces catenulae TaxID=66875 RepID=A0ABV2YSC2_9ACTN|nr:DUF4232 domain-containing protein [Streptomyces catenulae]